MKNQYIGDIGDYGKYGLLRHLSGKGIRIGVNWYLTKDDPPGFTAETKYLKIPEFRAYDEELYDKMQELAPLKDKTVCMIKESGLFPDIIFYDGLLNTDAFPREERKAERDKWHQAAMKELGDVEFVFLDPDNSLSRDVDIDKKGSQKYILPSEIEDYFLNMKKDVLYYHHRPRKNEAEWMKDKTIMAGLPGAKLLAVSAHRWVNRAYIFVVHEKRAELYREAIDGFLSEKWGASERGRKRPFFTKEDI